MGSFSCRTQNRVRWSWASVRSAATGAHVSSHPDPALRPTHTLPFILRPTHTRSSNSDSFMVTAHTRTHKTEWSVWLDRCSAPINSKSYHTFIPSQFVPNKTANRTYLRPINTQEPLYLPHDACSRGLVATLTRTTLAIHLEQNVVTAALLMPLIVPHMAGDVRNEGGTSGAVLLIFLLRLLPLPHLAAARCLRFSVPPLLLRPSAREGQPTGAASDQPAKLG